MFLIEYSIPQTFTVYQDIAISLLVKFLIVFELVLKFNRYFLTYYQLYWINSGAYYLHLKPFLPE